MPTDVLVQESTIVRHDRTYPGYMRCSRIKKAPNPGVIGESINKDGPALLWMTVNYSRVLAGRVQQPDSITNPDSTLDGDVSLHAYIRLVSRSSNTRLSHG